MFDWQTLVATPVRSLAARQCSRPRTVLLKTSFLPRRSSLTISRPSMLISGVEFRIRNRAIQSFEINHLALGFDIHPATLATQIATVDDRNIEERRKIFAALDAPFEFLDREHAFHAEIPCELPQAALVSCAE